jgi:hypothetical protein
MPTARYFCPVLTTFKSPISNFTQIRPVAGELIRVDRRTVRWETDVPFSRLRAHLRK